MRYILVLRENCRRLPFARCLCAVVPPIDGDEAGLISGLMCIGIIVAAEEATALEFVDDIFRSLGCT